MRHLMRRSSLRGLVAIASVLAIAAVAVVPGLSSANVNVSKSGWAWANPTPQGRTLLNIAFNGGVGYAVGLGGTALSTSDGGQSWTGLTTGTSADLERVQVLNPSTVVVGGGEGCVTRISENGGALFRRIFNVAESSCPEPVAAFSFTSPKQGFLLLKNGSVEVTTDGGESFARRTGIPGTAASSSPGSLGGIDVHFFSSTKGIAFVGAPGGAASAYTTPDGGVSWTAVTLPANSIVTSVHFVNEQVGYAVGPNTLLRTTNGGEKWEAQPIAGGNSFRTIDCSSEETCLLTVTGGNQLIETTDGGKTDTVKTTSSSLIYAAAYANATRIVAVGESGATVLSSDAGATFTSASADIGGQYGRLRAGPGEMLLAPGANGDVAISTNDGQTWQVLSTQTSQELVDVAFGTPTLGYALDAGGGLQRTTNGGASWQTLSPGTSRQALGGRRHRRKDRPVAGPGGHQPGRRRRCLRTRNGTGGQPRAGVRLPARGQHHLRLRVQHPHPDPVHRRRGSLERDPDAVVPQEEQGEENQGEPRGVDTQRLLHQCHRRTAAGQPGAPVEDRQQRAQLEPAEHRGHRSGHPAGLREPHGRLYERVPLRRR